MMETTNVTKPAQKQEREYLVHLRATFNGAWCRVSATSEEQAREKVAVLDLIDGVEIDSAELIDWHLTSIEPND